MFIESNSGERLRIEVKTSGRTVSKGKPVGWQHENIYFGGNKWDKLVFIDYDADDVMYITIVDYNQVVTNGQLIYHCLVRTDIAERMKMVRQR